MGLSREEVVRVSMHLSRRRFWRCTVLLLQLLDRAPVGENSHMPVAAVATTSAQCTKLFELHGSGGLHQWTGVQVCILKQASILPFSPPDG
jgi:hypothetical protein